MFGCVFWRPNIIVLCVQKPKRKREKEVGRGGESSSLITNTNTHKYLSSAPPFSGASETCMCCAKTLVVLWLLDPLLPPSLLHIFSIFFFCFSFCLVKLTAFLKVHFNIMNLCTYKMLKETKKLIPFLGFFKNIF